MNSQEIKEFAERVACLYIEHPRVEKIWDTLDSMIAHKRLIKGASAPRHLCIIGKSGVGKTQMAKKYLEKYPGYIYTDDEGNETDIRPTLYVELPDPFTILEFYQSIVKALGAPQLGNRPTMGEVKRQAFKLIEEQKVDMIIFDEMNYVLTSRYVKQEEAMEAIKHVANTANICIVCMGTPEVEQLCNLNFQYFRRYPIMRLNYFTECDEEFCKFLENIEKQLIPPMPIGLHNKEKLMPQLLHSMSKGLVGILTPTIQEAYRLLGLFDTENIDRCNIKLNVDLLYKAYKNIVGDITELELEKMLDKPIK